MKKLQPILLILTLVLTSPLLYAEPNEEALKLARDVIKAQHSDTLSQGLEMQFTRMFAAFSAKLSEEERVKAEKFWKEAQAALKEEFADWPEKMAVVYAEVFTVKELQSMKTFFESPEGRAFREKTPLVMQAMQPFQQKVQQNIQAKIKEIAEKMK